MMPILRVVGFVALFTLIAMAAKSASANNVFNCPPNDVTPQFHAESRTLEMPLVFIGEEGVWKNLFIEFTPISPDYSWGTYRILQNDNNPQPVSCSGFTQSNECRLIERLMCR